MQKIKQLGIDTWKQWKGISLIYFVQFLVGLIVSVTFYNEFSSSINNSMILDQLALGFDRTVLMDLMNSNEQLLGKTKNTALLLFGLYLFIGVFLQGGLLANIRKGTYSIQSLSKNGIRLLGPFLGMALISVILVVLVGGLIGTLFSTMVGDPLVTFSSEKPYVIWIVTLIIIFIFWSISIWAWSVISRCHYIDGNSFLKSLKFGYQTLKTNWFKFQALGMLIAGIHVLFMFIYYWIMGDRGAPTWLLVIMGIVVKQIFNYLRVVLRGFSYTAVEDMI